MFGSVFPQNTDRAPLRTFYRPYRNPGINQFYNLLFCDDFRCSPTAKSPGRWPLSCRTRPIVRHWKGSATIWTWKAACAFLPSGACAP